MNTTKVSVIIINLSLKTIFARYLLKILKWHEDKYLDVNKEKKNTILAYQTTEKEAQNYGVIKFNKKNLPIKIIEKPKKFISRYIVPGIYFLNKNSYKFIKKIKISKRKEYEISNFNELLLKKKMLNISRVGRGVAWFDAGSNTKLLQASLFIKTIQDRLGFKICCPEEIIFNFKRLNNLNIKNIIRSSKGDYRKYLLKCLKKKRKTFLKKVTKMNSIDNIFT